MKSELENVEKSCGKKEPVSRNIVQSSSRQKKVRVLLLPLLK